jgi:hypothetical protein
MRSVAKSTYESLLTRQTRTRRIFTKAKGPGFHRRWIAPVFLAGLVLLCTACGDDVSGSPANVRLVLTGIRVTTRPKKTTYTENEPFNSAGLILTADYSDASSAPLTTGYSLRWSNAFLPNGSTTITAAPGRQTVTVSYQNQSAEFDITVRAGVSLDSINLSVPDQYTYTIGESFNPEGLEVWASYSDYTISRIPAGYALTWNGVPLAAGDTAITEDPGDKTITVSYQDKTAEFNIYVDPLTAGVSVSFDGLPQDVTITLDGTEDLWQPLSWIENTPLIVTVEEAFTAYRWVLDGVVLTGKTGNTLTLFAGSLSVNRHTLTVFVTKDGSEYAKIVEFDVQ